MRILIVNPNTSAEMTESIGRAAQSVASAGVSVSAVCPPDGPPSIEGWHDDAAAACAMLETLRARREEADAFVIACFGDPGLDAARELCRQPVLGIAEAAMNAATMVADSFSIVTTLARTRAVSARLAREYGMTEKCRAIRAAEIPVLDLESNPDRAREIIRKECETAVREDDCGAIVLGCAGMADLPRQLAENLQIPVLDGVACAVRFAEALVGLGLSTSKKSHPAPLRKKYAGKLAGMSPE